MPLVPGVRPIMEIGGRVFTNLASLIVTYGYVSTGDGTKRTTIRKPDASTGYQVTAGKKYKISAAKLRAAATAATGLVTSLAYADNDVGVDTTTAWTNGVYRAGTQLNAVIGNGASALSQEDAFYFEVQAQKYPQIENVGAAATVLVDLYGYEEA